MFDKLKTQVAKNFKDLSANTLFYVAIDRDEIWSKYISGFAEDNRQEYNCNACKSFLRQWGGIVTIKNNKVISLWDNLQVPEEYADAIRNLREYVHSLPITDIFLNSHKNCGTDKNLDIKRGITWKHFYIELPPNVVKSNVDSLLGAARDNKNVLKRSLDELTLDSTETVLELIAQSSIYRGKEFEGMLKAFQTLQKQYAKVPQSEKDNFCWVNSLTSGAVSKIRNSSIGTLLIDLSEDVELDTAVAKFERVVAPANYKRPTALTTPRMVEDAKKKLTDLGLLESLNRRFANESDISTKDVIFKYKPSTSALDVFEQVSKDAVVNPKTFSKPEEIGIEDFIEKVVPNAKSISVLLENSHLSNMMSLITAQDSETPSLFKWDNPFSWSYSGGVADGIKERVKQAGGKVDGELRASLSWSNGDDLDIHVHEPNKNHIYFGSKVSATSGTLDVDMNAGGVHSRTPVENIIWTNKNKMQEGEYIVRVHNYNLRETKDVGFSVQIECNGESFDFDYHTSPRQSEYRNIVKFTYSKTDGIKFKGETKSNVISKEKWGVKTNQFHKVTKLMLSPNHWVGTPRTGNKHFFFILEGCTSDENPRPFLNEFLKPELDTHRKVLEVVGSKLKIEPTNHQLSGIGFSETVKNHLIVKVEGKFTRTLRVNF